MTRHPMHPYTRMSRQMQQQMHQQRHNEPHQEQEEPEDVVDIHNGTSPTEQIHTEPESGQAQTDAVSSLEEEKKSLEEERLRMAAEMDNFKKRLQREHQEQMRYASEKVLADLLPALDNLDLALQYGSQHDACRDMMQGIEMTRRQLLDAVEKNGLISVGERGEAFNPEVHEAIGMEDAPDLEKGTVSRVMQRGYKLNDRLIRPAKVMVNN